MISSSYPPQTARESDDGDQLQGRPFPQGHHSHGRAVVRGLSLSYRHVEELMEERGGSVDHATIQLRQVKYSPYWRKCFIAGSGRYGSAGAWTRPTLRLASGTISIAPDKHGQTIDFLLTEHRDKEAALRFLKKAIRRNGLPETITIDGSDANEAAIKSYNREQGTAIVIRQVKYLNNIVEQDRAVKRVTRRMLGFKSFDAAQGTLVGIELMHMIKKRQMLTFPYRYFSK